MMNLKSKKGVEFSFAWMFAIIAGIVIILLAIYAAVRLVGTEKEVKNAEVGKQLGILLSPVETSLESAKTAQITLPQETRVYNGCKLDGSNFGVQEISVSASSGVGAKWANPGVPSKFYNKYLFSSQTVQGNDMYVLSKPLSMPYKIADLMFVWSNEQQYCFVNAPDDVAYDITSLNIKNINLSSSSEDCPSGYQTVCFSSFGCSIDVDINSRTVKKKGQPAMHYSDTDNNALLYAAVFSDSTIYECQLHRLMKRASELALLYASKSDFLSTKSCGSESLQAQLIVFANSTRAFNSSIQLNSIVPIANQLEEENYGLSCKLF